MEVWKLEPVCKEYLWGGQRLKREFHVGAKAQKAAESWVLSVHEDGSNRVLTGRFKGKTLREVLTDKAFWGENAKHFDMFPVMIKLIDAADDLSIQVHPDDRMGMELEGQYGETEVWYVLDAEEGACLYYGLNRDVTREELKSLLQSGKLETVLNRVPVEAGDVFPVEAGTIHAIGKGILIAEVQQNSNVTYRLYDYERTDRDGKKRPLHIEKGLRAASLSKRKIGEKPESIGLKDGNRRVFVAGNPYFTTNVYMVQEKLELRLDRKSFQSIVVLAGAFVLDGIQVLQGESLFLPPCSAHPVIRGKGKLLITEATDVRK